jgi:hypothetical protein
MMTLHIRLGDRILVADVTAKSVRKAQQAVREASTGNLALLLQGRLAGDAISEGGLSTRAVEG